MKKVLCVLLSVVMLAVSCLCFAQGYSFDDLDEGVSEYPVIIVPGYGGAGLFTENGERVWGPDIGAMALGLLENIAKTGRALGNLVMGDAQLIGEVVGEQVVDKLGILRCNDDGTSVYPLRPISVEAAETNTAALNEKFPDGANTYELEIQTELKKYLDPSRIYNFTCDFRMGAEYNANMLRDYIDSVLEHSGADKVNIYSLSHGGQVTATYLALYGDDNKVDNVIMTSPAIGGAGIAYDPFAGEIDFDEETLIRFIEQGVMIEEDINWLLKANWLGILDDILYAVKPYFYQVMGNWGSIWDFMPPDKYDDAKELLLDETQHAGLIAKSDRFHYEIFPTIGERLRYLREEYGMNISIIAGYGNRIISGMNEDSDSIITLSSATGATTPAFGQRFADGYVQLNDCDGKYKVSPDMTVDASTCYLPDNTWFIKGMFHAFVVFDDYTMELVMKLLLTDEITDVYSDVNFPQFRDSTSLCHSVWARFDNNDSGYVNSDSKKLVVTNVCADSNINVTAVVCKGLDIKFKVDPTVKLAPGESIEIEYVGEIPQVSGKQFDVTVYYLADNLTPAGYRTQGYTVMNGENIEGGDDLVNVGGEPIISGVLAKLLKSLGLYEFVTMVIDVIIFAFSAISVR
ncbi:MAG: alpha/beta fold hydrolase [Clostridia bacterium]|nr:alpha/beta fold hydrolase [Clostridia bacterium]